MSGRYIKELIISNIKLLLLLQSFIVSGQLGHEFLTMYSQAIYRAKVRFSENHIVFLPTNQNNTTNWISTILEHRVILGNYAYKCNRTLQYILKHVVTAFYMCSFILFHIII